ncbi:hypothetical protein HMPREF1090_03937 [[Clostridium] clostridioforme 90A8]|uniref:Transposase DDE domain-containing protein n=1 Tax=[Clostridium] clostridioforme 90A8 TaxID=999408 RepID=A0A0E2H759_9FIRM|nr:hypothetical protein HMPREF1090_03937 [[Clostridium] clostridioforme 90A8]
MDILNSYALESNNKIKINFNGGYLSSNAGLLLIKEFAAKIGFVKLVKKLFRTNDTALLRFHMDADNLMQLIYQHLWLHSQLCPVFGIVWMKIPLFSLTKLMQK